MWTIVLAFLSKYWKYLTIPLVIGIIFYVGYFKGRKKCAVDSIKEVQKETEKRIERSYKEEDRINKIKKKYSDDKKINPINDLRDSCLLSNDPFDKDCLAK